ncbi:MAG: Hpt domain-containing protein [Gammaproteobacteria bacterium]|nr:Hpt domain-containing protein [Gammaproteobacteria bacterium]
MDLEQAQKLLERLRRAYLDELPTKLDRVEDLVLQLGRGEEGRYEELYRNVHSIKGSAGTHGFGEHSSICHQFEDQLSTIDIDAPKLLAQQVDILLKYVDLLREATDVAAAGRTYAGVHEQLNELRRARLSNQYPGLIIESSNTTVMLCRQSLAQLPVELTVERNGLIALERLLYSRYAFVVSGYQLEGLNGLAVMSALRMSGIADNDAPFIMLTSGRDMNVPGPFKPDAIIKRDTQLVAELRQAVKKIIERTKH